MKEKKEVANQQTRTRSLRPINEDEEWLPFLETDPERNIVPE